MSISAVKGVVHFTLGDHFILAYTQNNNKKHKTKYFKIIYNLR